MGKRTEAGGGCKQLKMPVSIWFLYPVKIVSAPDWRQTNSPRRDRTNRHADPAKATRPLLMPPPGESEGSPPRRNVSAITGGLYFRPMTGVDTRFAMAAPAPQLFQDSASPTFIGQSDCRIRPWPAASPRPPSRPSSPRPPLREPPTRPQSNDRKSASRGLWRKAGRPCYHGTNTRRRQAPSRRLPPLLILARRVATAGHVRSIRRRPVIRRTTQDRNTHFSPCVARAS
ncbi:hypothetical protein SAMN04488026_10133 [Aliiruegeria lutimaris]|uniref:Uncharacterized protein n=1 Tax=Aliiruegeria lutimaris TaxID=571298 RepID=A0A1G8RFC2_9RHOB|nr:hypothetical protein SAMN04488026_10133 [Aliiruegeria lutimaris]